MNNFINLPEKEFWEYKEKLDNDVIEMRDKINYHTSMLTAGLYILYSFCVILILIILFDLI